MTAVAFVLRMLVRSLPRRFGVADDRTLIQDSLGLVEAERRRRGRLAAAWLAARIVVDLVVSSLAAFAGRLKPAPFFRPVLREVRFAWRRARRGRLSTAMAILVCALAVGSTVAVGGVVAAAFVEAGGADRPDRIVSLQWQLSNPQTPVFAEFSYPDYEQIRSSDVFMASSASAYATATCSCTGPGRLVDVGLVTSDFFAVFGVRPSIGQFPARDDVDTVVLSAATWRAAFGGSVGALGERVEINDRRYTVVGVAPASFVGPVFGVEPAVWLPMAAQSTVLPMPAPLRRFGTDALHMRGYSWAQVWGRLRDGMTPVSAGERLHQQFPNIPDPGGRVQAVRFQDARVPPQLRDVTRRFLLGLSLVVALIIALAAAALMQLSVLRAEQTLPDMALRLSLGAPLGPTLALPIIDTAALVAMGGGLGFALAPLLLQAFVVTLPPSASPIHLSVDVLTWRTGVLALGLLLGLALLPPLVACVRLYRRRHEFTALLGGQQRRSLAGLRRASGVAVLLQVTAGAALLGVAFVVTRFVIAADQADLGFRPERLLVASIDVERRNLSDTDGLAFLTHLRSTLGAVPDVLAVTLATYAPLNVLERGTVFDLDPRPRDYVQTDTNFVDPNFFEVLGVRVLQGSSALGAGPGGPPVANARYIDVVDRARRQSGLPPLQPAGVVANVRYRSIFGDVEPLNYASLEHHFEPRVKALIRVKNSSARTVETVRTALAEVWPDLRNSVIRPIDANREVVEWVPRALMRIIGLFTVIALAVSVAGTFSVVAFVGQRRRYEFAIRAALGATATRVVWLSVSTVAWPIIAGSAIGVALACRAAPSVAAVVGAPATGVLVISAAGALTCGLVAFVAALLAGAPAGRVDIAKILKVE